MTHPGWVMEYIRHGGTPALGNWLPYLPNGASAEETVKFNRSQVPAISRRPGASSSTTASCFLRNLIVKGIMHPADAERCAQIGCDGIIVSNHGARQLTIRHRPRSTMRYRRSRPRSASKMTIMLDSGVRRGA